MIKLIASDLDGTLLRNGNMELSREMLDIIQELQNRGIHFVSASGRQYTNQLSLYGDALASRMSFISDNGGMYIHNGAYHIQEPMDPDLVKRLILTSREIPSCQMCISSRDTIYFEDQNAEFTHLMEEVLENDTQVVEDLLEVEDTIIKMAICDGNGTQESEAIFKERFEGECVVVTSGNFWVDFMPNGVNKGLALKNLIREMEIEPEECMAFGDQFNDIEMLSLVGTSYAMADCAPGVEAYASAQTDSVEATLREFLDRN